MMSINRDRAANFQGLLGYTTLANFFTVIDKAREACVNVGQMAEDHFPDVRKMQAGSTLVVCIGSTIGKLGFAGRELVTNQQINAVMPNAETCERFVYYEIERVSRQLKRLAGTQAVPILSKSEFGVFPVVIPPLPEQRRIAEILSAWDEGLEKLDALIAAKECRKKGLMQQLLSGKKRGKGVIDKRVTLPASALFSARSERNVEGLPALSVTQDQGVLLRSELDRRIQHDEKNLHTYKLVRKGDFIISLRAFEGGLEYAAITGAVSPAYHVIYPRVALDCAFYKHYFKSPSFIGHLATAVIGIRDGKQVNINDFMILRLPCPSVPEQRAIAEILDACDDELRLLRAQCAALDQQKRGLMQRLLTGRTRT